MPRPPPTGSGPAAPAGVTGAGAAAAAAPAAAAAGAAPRRRRRCYCHTRRGRCSPPRHCRARLCRSRGKGWRRWVSLLPLPPPLPPPPPPLRAPCPPLARARRRWGRLRPCPTPPPIPPRPTSSSVRHPGCFSQPAAWRGGVAGAPGPATRDGARAASCRRPPVIAAAGAPAGPGRFTEVPPVPRSPHFPQPRLWRRAGCAPADLVVRRSDRTKGAALR
jgi:hypothetical protein